MTDGPEPGAHAAELPRTAAPASAGARANPAEKLVEDTYRQVYAALHRLTGGDAELAADLTQDTYRKAWASLDRFEGRAQAATWLYRIAYNTFLNHIRRPAPVEPLDAVPPPADPAPRQDDLLSTAEVAERLRRAVIALPEELRFTVTARFWGELPVAEIAELESITGAAVRKRLKNAVARLRIALEEDAV
jgi:RNA polymerase sigma-70 factor (ECF subfamily)